MGKASRIRVGRWRDVRRPVRQLAGLIFDCVLPPVCAGCGASTPTLCSVCEAQLGRRGAGCPRCGEPVVPGQKCTADHAVLRNLAFLIAPYRFAGTGGALVRRFKLDGDPAAGRLLASAIWQSWQAGPGRHWRRAIVCSVPLHRSKLRQRGFDQAEWLATRFAERQEWQFARGLLLRSRPTLAQGDARTTSRERNVAAAFDVTDGACVRGRRVVLVDDVFTSGATLRECARRLREAGAAEVAGQVACRS